MKFVQFVKSVFPGARPRSFLTTNYTNFEDFTNYFEFPISDVLAVYAPDLRIVPGISDCAGVCADAVQILQMKNRNQPLFS